jgi:hypothetical protein
MKNEILKFKMARKAPITDRNERPTKKESDFNLIHTEADEPHHGNFRAQSH